MHTMLCCAGMTAAIGICMSLPAPACVDPGPPPNVWITFHPGEAPDTCPWDLNGDGRVDQTDQAILQGMFGPCPGCPADFDGDGDVDRDDLSELQAHFGDCQPPIECIWITIHDYQSFGAGTGQFCACALNALGPIVEITEVHICNAATGAAIPGWDFTPNAVTGNEFNLAAGGGNFVGFLAQTTMNIPFGLDLDLKFKVGVPEGTTFDELANAIGPGPGFGPGPPFIGTGEGAPDGTLVPGHTTINSANTVGLMPLDDCPEDCAPAGGNGFVNIDDLFAVVNAIATQDLQCDVAPMQDNGSFGNGFVNIDDLFAVLNAFGPCPNTVVISDVSPPGGREGDIITILGSGFDPNPDNNCAVVMMGGPSPVKGGGGGPPGACSLGLKVLTVNPEGTQLTARVGPVWEGATPGPVKIATGVGQTAFFQPVFPDINVQAPVWTWNRHPNGPNGCADDEFTPLDPQPKTHGEPMNGVICATISGDWPDGTKIMMEARAHHHPDPGSANGYGHDALFPCVTLEMGGNAVQCASKICDMIRCAFLQHNPPIQIGCCVDDLGNNTAKITLKFENGDTIDWGNLDICVFPNGGPTPRYEPCGPDSPVCQGFDFGCLHEVVAASPACEQYGIVPGALVCTQPCPDPGLNICTDIINGWIANDPNCVFSTKVVEPDCVDCRPGSVVQLLLVP